MSKKLKNKQIVAKLAHHDALILHQSDIIKVLEKSLKYIWDEVCTDDQRLVMTMMADEEREERDRKPRIERVTLN